MSNDIFICALCGVKKTTATSFSRHLLYSHDCDIEKYYDTHMDSSSHKCPYCDRKRKFLSIGKGYLKTCGANECSVSMAKETNLLKYGTVCSANSEECQMKSRKTKLERYGDENYHNVERARQTKLERYGTMNYVNSEKAKRTCLTRYGVEHPAQSSEILAKTKATNKERYGREWAQQTESFKRKSRNTCIERYGVDNVRKASEIKEKICDRAKQTCLAKYGVDHSFKSKDVRNKAKQTCLTRYGVEHPAQSSEIASKMKSTLKKHYGVEHPAQSSEIASRMRKKISHDGLNFDSNAEVAVYRYCKEHDIDVVYQPRGISYEDKDGNEHIYHPDFEIAGKLYEVKGKHLWKDGHLYFPYRTGKSQEELSRIDALYEAKFECMKANGVIVLLESDLGDLASIFMKDPSTTKDG